MKTDTTKRFAFKGGRISAERKEAATKIVIELIRADWPKSSSEFPT
jgi:hypothetical protein